MRRKTLAIPIRITDFSNSSQVVALFTRDLGLVDGIVKGAHRPKNTFQGCFDLAVLREVVIIERRSGLAIVAESSVVDGYRGLRASWARFVAACHIIEYLRAVAMSGDVAVELFDLSRATLATLAAAARDDLGTTLLHFELRSLRLLGFLGDIDSCVRCGRPWPGRGRGAYFSAREAGLICRRCRERSADARVAALRGATVEVLRELAGRETLSGLRPVEPGLRRQLELVAQDSSTFFLDRNLRTLQYRSEWS